MSEVILLTGGTGYLGSFLLKFLVNHSYQVILLKRKDSALTKIQDVMDKIIIYDIESILLETIFEKHAISKIIHCATNYGRQSQDISAVAAVNLMLPLTLLGLAKRHKILVFINTDTMLPKEVSDYALSKKQFLPWLKKAADTLVCINMPLEHFYGPGDGNEKFITYLIKSLLNNIPVLDLTAGEQLRDFIYINDVIRAFEIVLEASAQFTVGFYEYQVGTGKCISLKTLIEKIKLLTNNYITQLNFGAKPYRKNELMTSRVDLTAMNSLGWQPLFSLENGLQETIHKEMKMSCGI